MKTLKDATAYVVKHCPYSHRFTKTLACFDCVADAIAAARAEALEEAAKVAEADAAASERTAAVNEKVSYHEGARLERTRAKGGRKIAEEIRALAEKGSR